MFSKDNYAVLSESKQADEHRVKVTSDIEDKVEYGALSIESPLRTDGDADADGVSAIPPTRKWSKKKKVVVSVLSAVVLSLLAFIIAVVVELLLVRPQLSMSPNTVSFTDAISVKADASFVNPPRLSNIRLSSASCKLYGNTGTYFATATVDNAQVANDFQLNAHVESVDMTGFSTVVDEVLAARHADPSDKSAIKAVCAAAVTVSDSVFGASYTKDLAINTAVTMQELWSVAREGTGMDGMGRFEWVDVQMPKSGVNVEVAPFMYLANLQTPGTDSADSTGSMTSTESPLGCYAVRSNGFSYKAQFNDVRSAAQALYSEWINNLDYRRESCKDVCRNKNHVTAHMESDGIAVLTVCSPSNTFINNLLGDHEFHAFYEGSSTLHAQLQDTIQQHSSIGIFPASYISTYTAAHALMTSTIDQSVGRVAVVPPQIVQAMGVDATLIGNYSYNFVSSKVASVAASVVLAANNPASSGFSLNANADFNFLMNFVSASQWALNVSADFSSTYSPSSASSMHYGGAVLAAGVLDPNAQSLKLSADFGFDDNGHSFAAPTQYGADIFGQYSNTNNIMRVDTNGDVSWSNVEQSMWVGSFVLDQNQQLATVAFSEHTESSATTRTGLTAASFYSLSNTAGLVRFALRGGNGLLTTNYSPRSAQQFAASLVMPTSVAGDFPFVLNITVNERAPSDPVSSPRVLVDQSINLRVALQAASTISFSWNGTIVANYQAMTQYQSQFLLNTQKGSAQLSFYEGGPNDFPAVRTASPRTAYYTVMPLIYTYSYTSSSLLNTFVLSLNVVNGSGALVFSRAVQSLHSSSFSVNLRKDVLGMYNFSFIIDVAERAGSDSVGSCRFCLHQNANVIMASSSSVFQQSETSFRSSGSVSAMYSFLSAWSAAATINGRLQVVNLAVYEGGQNDYPNIPTGTPRTSFITNPGVSYQYSMNNGLSAMAANGGAQLTYGYNQVSQERLNFTFVNNGMSNVQVDFTFTDHFATDVPTVFRVLIDEHMTFNSAPADENAPDLDNVAILSEGTLNINYNVLSSYTLQFGLNTLQGQVSQLAFYEGGSNDYPYNPSGTARTAYLITAPFIYAFSYTQSPLALNLNVNGAGELVFSHSIKSVHSISTTLNLAGSQSVASLYSFMSINERGGNDPSSLCRVCVSEISTATIPYSSRSFSQVATSLSSSGSLTINYNFLTSFVLSAGVDGSRKIITLNFAEGGQQDYPSVPSAPPRTAYQFTPNVQYNFNSMSSAAMLSVSGAGQLTFNRQSMSMHSLQLVFGYTSAPSGQLMIYVNESNPNSPTVLRVMVNESATFSWASPQGSISSNGALIANYNFMTAHSMSAAVDIDAQTVQFAFYEGGQNDFPNQPNQPPRTAYVLNPASYKFSYTASPLALSIGGSGSGQLTFQRSLQSIHSATISLTLQNDAQSVSHFQLITNIAERSGNDAPSVCRECISQTTSVDIPMSSSAFNNGPAKLASAGTITIQYNLLSQFALAANVDGSQNSVQVSFAEGGSNDGPAQPSQSPRTAFNLQGPFNFSSSPLIISSSGHGNLTYARALQSTFDYSFLFNNVEKVVVVSVSATTPSSTSTPAPADSTVHSLRTSLSMRERQAHVSLVSTNNFQITARAEASMQISCNRNSLLLHSNIHRLAGCLDSWQSISNTPNLLCHVDTERRTAGVSSLCEANTNDDMELV